MSAKPTTQQASPAKAPPRARAAPRRRAAAPRVNTTNGYCNDCSSDDECEHTTQDGLAKKAVRP